MGGKKEERLNYVQSAWCIGYRINRRRDRETDRSRGRTRRVPDHHGHWDRRFVCRFLYRQNIWLYLWAPGQFAPGWFHTVRDRRDCPFTDLSRDSAEEVKFSGR